MADFLDYDWLRVMLMVAARHDLSPALAAAKQNLQDA
jgi:hypothetical protein